MNNLHIKQKKVESTKIGGKDSKRILTQAKGLKCVSGQSQCLQSSWAEDPNGFQREITARHDEGWRSGTKSSNC